MSSVYTKLLDRITSRRARVGVVGLGYVGLPLAVEVRPGRIPHGRHRRRRREGRLREPGSWYVPDVAGEHVADLVREGLLMATPEFQVVERTVNHHAIADRADLVVDARNAVKRRAPHVFRLGAPAPALVPEGEAEAVIAQAG